jgi:phage FluMu protein gp41
MVAVANWPLTPAEQARLVLAGRIRHPFSPHELEALAARELARQQARAVRQAEALLAAARR